jgi:hypothetical protein
MNVYAMQSFCHFFSHLSPAMSVEIETTIFHTSLLSSTLSQVPFNSFLMVCVFAVHIQHNIARPATAIQQHEQKRERQGRKKRKILLPFMKIELSSRINQSFLTIYLLFLSFAIQFSFSAPLSPPLARHRRLSQPLLLLLFFV